MHITLTVLLAALLVGLTDPFMVFMPSMAQMTVLLVASALVGIWCGFVMKENAADEREAFHRMIADRNAYLVGIGLLTVALLVHGFAHSIDSWIPLTLAGMIVTKTVSRLYADRNL